MTFDNSEWEKEDRWIKAKAKEARYLNDGDLAFLDSRISNNLRDSLKLWAVRRWWDLFGSQGHSLESWDDELGFIDSLNKVFVYPAPSTLLAKPRHERQEYTVRETTRTGVRRTVSFYGPPPTRLLELMLYGFFDFDGRWIFISRSNTSPNGQSAPEQWHVMPEDFQPTDRLGVRVTVSGYNYHKRRHHPPPNAIFSNLPGAAKEGIAARTGTYGSHQQWLEGIAEGMLAKAWRGSPLARLELAGDYDLACYPLADLIASGKQISGRLTIPANGNYFDCRPENLTSRSSRGRKMACNYCHKPTTARESSRVKDSTGSTFRICRACQATIARLLT